MHQIRRVHEDEWVHLRELRLRALSEDPFAFGSLVQEERNFPEVRWRDIARGHVFVAVREERWVGMAGCFPSDDGVMIVWGMWVDPAARSQGVGAALLDETIACARKQGFEKVRLSVTQENAVAEGLYRSRSFRDTGNRKPLRSNPSLMEVELERPV